MDEAVNKTAWHDPPISYQDDAYLMSEPNGIEEFQTAVK